MNTRSYAFVNQLCAREGGRSLILIRAHHTIYMHDRRPLKVWPMCALTKWQQRTLVGKTHTVTDTQLVDRGLSVYRNADNNLGEVPT